MTRTSLAALPRVSDLQLAWLQEIGVDRRLLPRETLPVLRTTTASTARDEKPSVKAPAVAQGAPDQSLTQRTQRPSRQGAGPLAANITRRPDIATPHTAPLDPPRALEMPLVGDLDALAKHVQQCQDCPLHTSRTQAVFGAGAVDAPQWLLIGEAPGERDDRLGLPFQGKAGELLQAMFAAAGVDIEQAGYSTNLVKCRPRGNRMPQTDEIKACGRYLKAQIAVLQPRRILALGRLAASALLDDDASFEELRGKVHYYPAANGLKVPLVVTYHPASLLSRPMQKAAAWRDLNLALNALPS